jgi:hypothetical protein
MEICLQTKFCDLNVCHLDKWSKHLKFIISNSLTQKEWVRICRTPINHYKLKTQFSYE